VYCRQQSLLPRNCHSHYCILFLKSRSEPANKLLNFHRRHPKKTRQLFRVFSPQLTHNRSTCSIIMFFWQSSFYPLCSVSSSSPPSNDSNCYSSNYLFTWAHVLNLHRITELSTDCMQSHMQTVLTLPMTLQSFLLSRWTIQRSIRVQNLLMCKLCWQICCVQTELL
jgi:hypothetical protein